MVTAVLAQQVITSAGTAPVSFMKKVMESVGRNDDNLQFYIGLHAAQFGGMQRAA